MKNKFEMKTSVRIAFTLAMFGLGVLFVKMAGVTLFALYNTIQYWLSGKTIGLEFTSTLLWSVYMLLFAGLLVVSFVEKTKEKMLVRTYYITGEIVWVGFRSSEFLLPLFLIVSILAQSPFLMGEIPQFALFGILIVLIRCFLHVAEKARKVN